MPSAVWHGGQRASGAAYNSSGKGPQDALQKGWTEWVPNHHETKTSSEDLTQR
eukprot:CAMPEP_0174366760 /NCGR_PEP_ID=MMETSP0811_2-20130205/82476_1 /TAXON_ID=73025 ORGANISM="Eutreptiella gymnastica-like, Strain CCMP1594" /NCGR_SAMPLE_ID=MMETSP0811_2 /ASSEMBLY_ACC=CAM_ASM_000667 /LENGTH=52 /DNA_ID=CAMNT_0015508625 /DNA_START=233 /DNA_END=391 /DNA_ORIENTATION=-